jgi:DNA-binding NarL/FixJ family response regulator
MSSKRLSINRFIGHSNKQMSSKQMSSKPLSINRFIGHSKLGKGSEDTDKGVFPIGGQEMHSRDMQPSRILLADNHHLFRSTLRQLLSRPPAALEVVGEAFDGQEALELCRRLQPDLVLMDVRMPRMGGIEATSAIREEFPQIIVLIMTSFGDPEFLSEALKAGAAGYILKTAPTSRISDSIRRALIGEAPLNQEIAMHLLQRLISEESKENVADPASARPSEGLPSEARSRPPLPARPPLPKSLTPKELEVLQLVAQGQSNQQIARDLQVSVSTIKKHVHCVINKLEVSDRTQAAIVALKCGLLAEPLSDSLTDSEGLE